MLRQRARPAARRCRTGANTWLVACRAACYHRAVNKQNTAIVTGSSRGIGARIAKRLAADGFTVVVNYAGSREAAQAVVAEIEASGGAAIAVQADVARPEQITELFDAAIERFGGVDVLVNNAGMLANATLQQTDDETMTRMLDINVKGTFHGMREAANRMRDGGRIVNLSTSVVGLYLPTYGAYVASKAAVEAMTRVLAKELGPRGITVNAVAPGPVATDLFLEGKSDELIAQLKARIPLGRLGEVDDIAPVVSFLAGPDGGWVNGQVLRANGGII